MRQIFFLLLLNFICSPLFAQEVYYVQALKAPLKSEPKMTSETLSELSRATPLTSISTNGQWVQFTHDSKTGWISKLLLSKTKPVGAAEILNNSTDASAAKASRKRSSDYSVSAATRGLTASDRVRNGEAMYRSDMKAVETLEKKKITDQEVLEFDKNAPQSSDQK
jgi:hypothetical protein